MPFLMVQTPNCPPHATWDQTLNTSKPFHTSQEPLQTGLLDSSAT